MSTDSIRLYDVQISDVSSTSLLTIYCHAIESQSKAPILHDPKAVELTRSLNEELIKSKDRFIQRLTTGRLKRKLIVHIAMRARKYDEYVEKFLARYPEGVVVNMGCGMDTRFWRVDNGSVRFYDLDLPEVINLKRRFFQETVRYHFIASSVLDHGWMVALLRQEKGPFLFLAEGLFMYLPGDEVRSLVTGLRSKFPGSELVCEVVDARWAKKPFSDIVSFKMQRELLLGAGTRYQSGLRRSDEMEGWSPGIRLLEDWSYFDEQEPKLGWMRLFRHFELFRKLQYTVHYRLG